MSQFGHNHYFVTK